MDKLTYKHQKLLQALTTLENAINALDSFVKAGTNYSPHLDYEEGYRTFRDSEIQRFEYSVDLFWKYLKKYLEARNITLDIAGPADVIRKCFAIKLLNEHEAETILEMVKQRNKTSHIYVEEIAEYLVHKIPNFYTIMHAVAQKTQNSS